MPVLNVTGTSSDLESVVNHINTVVNEGRLIAASETSFTFRVFQRTVEFTGTGFDFVDDQPLFGTVTALRGGRFADGTTEFTIDGLQFGASLLTIAIQSEDGGSPAALESLLLSENYTFVGGSGADVLVPTAETDPGVPVDFSGNDRFVLRNGRDLLDSGGGDDSVFGGGGRDNLFGGSGNDFLTGGGDKDRINGGRGKDEIVGGRGADALFGSGGADRLSGGAGNDKIFGNEGRDVLTGGAGADVFRFRPGDGPDRITDFEDGTDRFRMLGTTYEIVERSDGTVRIQYDGGRIILTGIEHGQITDADFL
jgi:Ca2+-binding RTX toxin-like protein